MSVVSNASPLINMARIGQLDLLNQLYGELWIPIAVWNEVVTEGAGQPGASEVGAAGWIKRRAIANEPLVQAMRHELDAGEAEAIALALETDAKLLLMDERLGREVAQHFDIRCVGLIGSLVEAKRRGLISEVREAVDRLRDIAGFRISQALYELVLKDSGEAG